MVACVSIGSAWAASSTLRVVFVLWEWFMLRAIGQTRTRRALRRCGIHCMVHAQGRIFCG